MKTWVNHFVHFVSVLINLNQWAKLNSLKNNCVDLTTQEDWWIASGSPEYLWPASPAVTSPCSQSQETRKDRLLDVIGEMDADLRPGSSWLFDVPCVFPDFHGKRERERPHPYVGQLIFGEDSGAVWQTQKLICLLQYYVKCFFMRSSSPEPSYEHPHS